MREVKTAMETELERQQRLISEIQRRIAYVLSTDDFTSEEKEQIARSFFQAIEEGAD